MAEGSWHGNRFGQLSLSANPLRGAVADPNSSIQSATTAGNRFRHVPAHSNTNQAGRLKGEAILFLAGNSYLPAYRRQGLVLCREFYQNVSVIAHSPCYPQMVAEIDDLTDDDVERIRVTPLFIRRVQRFRPDHQLHPEIGRAHV